MDTLAPTFDRVLAEDHARATAAASFHRRLAPLFALASYRQDVTDLFVDGGQVVIATAADRIAFQLSEIDDLSLLDVRAACSNAAVYKGADFGPDRPHLSVRMPPDLRVTAARPPISDDWHLAVRFLGARELTLDDYVRDGVATERQVDDLRHLIHLRRNLLVSGGTGAGKTTLLRALLREADASPTSNRILVLEDTSELVLPHAVHYEADEQANVTLADLVKLAMRSQPDRIVVGEVRGVEALDLVSAMNTGHAGTLATVHSNGGPAALRRLHLLCRRAMPGFLMDEITDAIDAVAQLSLVDGKRRLTDIWRVPKEQAP